MMIAKFCFIDLFLFMGLPTLAIMDTYTGTQLSTDVDIKKHCSTLHALATSTYYEIKLTVNGTH